jgi:hypothetical protein
MVSALSRIWCRLIFPECHQTQQKIFVDFENTGKFASPAVGEGAVHSITRPGQGVLRDRERTASCRCYDIVRGPSRPGCPAKCGLPSSFANSHPSLSLSFTAVKPTLEQRLCLLHESSIEGRRRRSGFGSVELPGATQAEGPPKARYDPSSESAVSTRARMGVLPSWERMRLASVRCWTARARFLLPL